MDWLTEKMHQRDFTVSAMHGDMDQKVRPHPSIRSSVLDPDSGVFWILNPYPGSYKSVKMLKNQNIFFYIIKWLRTHSGQLKDISSFNRLLLIG